MDQEKKSFGPLIGIIVIIALILVGGIYFWGSMFPEARPESLTETDTPPAEIDSIQADINASATNTPSDFSDIETELGR